MDNQDQIQQALIQVGAAVLARYAHPGHWRPQYSSGEESGHGNTKESMRLLVTELSPQTHGLQRAKTIAQAIRAWANSVGLPAGQLNVREPHMGMPGQRNLYQPYISVSAAVWPHVLRKLVALHQRPGQQRRR